MLLLIVVFDVIRSPSAMGQQGPSEFEVKAVYLYHFGKFIRWPIEPERGAFVICVLGDDPFGPILDRTLADETLGGKPVSVKRVRDLDETEDCLIAFISASEARRLPQILERLRGKSILTVSDATDFASRGGMIELVLQDSRVRFDVDLSATRAAGLELSSELLKVARRVRGVKPGAS